MIYCFTVAVAYPLADACIGLGQRASPPQALAPKGIITSEHVTF